MDSINALTSLPARSIPARKPGPPAAAGPAIVGVGADEHAGERARAGVNRNRYRVDEAYRSYHEPRTKSQAPRSATAGGEAVRISSAELLESMIHQMGGAAMPSAKGVFVDIAV